MLHAKYEERKSKLWAGIEIIPMEAKFWSNIIPSSQYYMFLWGQLDDSMELSG